MKIFNFLFHTMLVLESSCYNGVDVGAYVGHFLVAGSLFPQKLTMRETNHLNREKKRRRNDSPGGENAPRDSLEVGIR